MAKTPVEKAKETVRARAKVYPEGNKYDAQIGQAVADNLRSPYPGSAKPKPKGKK